MGRGHDNDQDFHEFVVARSVALQRTAYLLTGNWASAEDLLQTTLVKTYLAWRRLGGIDVVEPYARAVMVNTATRWWRRKWHGERATEVLPERPVADGVETWVEHDRVWQAIMKLPSRQRAILVLRFYEDLSEADIAQLMDISTGTVKSHSARAFATLRRYLDPAHVTEPSAGGTGDRGKVGSGSPGPPQRPERPQRNEVVTEGGTR